MKQLLFLFIFLISVQLFAQNNNSFVVVNNQNEFKDSGKLLLLKESDNLSITGAAQLNKLVFGFLPDWVYSSDVIKELRFDLLTHIAVTPFNADVNGNLSVPFNWPWNGLLNDPRRASVKLIMTVVNFNTKEINTLLTNSVAKNKLIENIKLAITANKFDGVNIDFENVGDADQQLAIVNFMALLKQSLTQLNPLLQVSFSSPIINFGKWDFKSLANSCDYLFIMAYDFYGKWSSTTGPSAPLDAPNYGFTNSIKKALENDYALADPGKLILGVPYYGNYWKSTTKNPYVTVDTTAAKREWLRALYYNEIISSYGKYEKMWDTISKTPWIRWQDTTWNQIWYDDEISLGEKYNLAIEKKLKGIGIWALGYDFGRKELWNLIEKKFTPTNVIASQNIPNNFALYQNYPNPFNPSTVISYNLPVNSFVVLKIYDMLGREVKTIVYSRMNAGSYNVIWNGDDNNGNKVPSGIYLYEITANNFIQSKKMILIK